MKKTSKLLAFILAVLMMVTPMPAGTFAADTYTDPELARAVELGFGKYSEDNPTVTFSQFMVMLDNAVKLADGTKLEEWQGIPELQNARESSESMTRSDGIFAVFCAAETLGGDYARYNCDNWGNQWTKLGNNEGDTAQNYRPSDEVFGADYMQQTPKILFRPQDDHEDRRGDALIYSFARASHFNSRPIFDIDVKNNTMRTEAPFLFTEAMLATLRLHESGSTSIQKKNVSAPIYISERYLTGTDKEIISNANTRKQAILNSPAEVIIKGTKYYVSNSGNDSNDGKSPGQAWATLDKVNNAELKSGDGVFFERDGVWRNAFLWANTGVTYSAYGEGNKPQLLGSPENGANPAYWELVPGTDNIWQYHIEMNEVGLMLVNNDEDLMDKYVAYWDIKQQKYVVTFDLKTPFSFSLLENHQFFCDTDLKGLQGGQLALSLPDDMGDLSNDPGVPTGQNGSSLVVANFNRTGKFYFRCDEGNPGEVYKSIEFAMVTYSKKADGGSGDIGGPIIQAQDKEDITLDNLCVKYSGDGGVFVGKGATIQNCEIAYIGGAVIAHTPPEVRALDPGAERIRDCVWVEDGHGIVIGNASNVVIKNSYVHDTINSAFNIEHMLNGTYKNFRAEGNLFERSGVGFILFNFFSNDNPEALRFQDFFIDNNYWMYTGYFADRADHGYSYPILNYSFFHPQQFENINYTNNVFYITKGSMFHLADNSTLNIGNFSGNTYAQNNGGIILRDETNGERSFYDENAEQTIKELTGDNTAIVLPLSFAPAGSENDGE